MFTALLALVNAGVIGFALYLFVISYQKSEGAWYQRAYRATHDSAVMLWSYFLLFASDLLLWSDKAAELVVPQIQANIDKIPTQYVAIALAVITGINMLARLRGLIAAWKAARQ